jgi:hypothetical protein
MSARTRHKGADQLLAYEALAALNQGFVQILENLRRLKELGILNDDLGTALTVALEETRAWANFETTEVLHDREQTKWGRLGRLRRQWEEKYEDPNDLLLAVKRRKNQRQRRIGKKRSAAIRK